MTFTSAGAQAASGPSGRITVDKSPNEAYDAAIAAMKAAAFEISTENRPDSVTFGYAKQGTWSTAGVRVTYTGTLTAAKADGCSVVSMTSAVNWNSTAPLFNGYAVFFLVMTFFVYYALPLALLSAGYSAWMLASKTPEDASKAILGAIQAAK